VTATAPPIHDAVPFLDALRAGQEQGMMPFSCPGHKRGQGAASDVRALLGDAVFDHDVWLNTGDHDRLRREAEALAARVWGADRSFFLVNGSSSGNHAYLLAAVGPGDEVVVARDLHTSLLVGLILTGARPVYVAPRAHPELGVGLGVTAEDVAATLDRHPSAKLVTLVSPSHDGVVSDLAGVVDVAHARGVPVYVDQAWGPHLGFHPGLPAGAMAAGADGAVTSTHKFLSSLSQSSLLNVHAGLVDPARVAATVRMTQTTSPLLPLLASLDACRQQLAIDGERLLGQAIELAADARRRLRMLPGLDVLGPTASASARAASTRSSWSSTCPGWGCAGRRPNGCCGSASPSPPTAATSVTSSAWSPSGTPRTASTSWSARSRCCAPSIRPARPLGRCRPSGARAWSRSRR
jgi:arginine/lysine/ornithine decarboxylase